MDVQAEVRFCGLRHHLGIIDQIIEDLHLQEFAFEVRLILSEAISNAFFHGNRGDDRLPIWVRYSRQSSLVQLEIEDSGDGLTPVLIPDEVEPEALLEENGRGLYLIRCFADCVTFTCNKLQIRKTIGQTAS
ncbi:ATP-binding protein [Gorillibacterium sp. CAU 1737]|uniref:ATP-binding protein n=1 Tax=Gorillibacterium sp. CAU 1737 TaxID=3140362 RepID=UPI0032605B16